MKFKEELIITIVDNLLIGAIIIILAYLFNKLLEKFKSRQSFLNEIAKERVSKISECWEVIYSWEYNIQSLYTLMAHMSENAESVQSYNEKLRSNKNIDELIKNINQQFPKVKETIEKNRFWTGNDLYRKFVGYGSSLYSCVDAFINSRWDEFMSIHPIIEKEKDDIISLIDKMKI